MYEGPIQREREEEHDLSYEGLNGASGGGSRLKKQLSLQEKPARSQGKSYNPVKTP